MRELSSQELETIAAAYERQLVPTLFAPWTGPMLDAARIHENDRVLDVACGTGVLTRAIAASVGSGESVIGLDLNPGMLAVARNVAPMIQWRQGEAEKLPFEDQAFDTIVCQFGLMFFPDRVAALRDMKRVLSPAGRLVLAVFDNLENNTGYAAMASVYERQIGKDAGEALRFPFILGDKSELLGYFSTAGIVATEVTTPKKTVRFTSVRDMVLADVQGWFPLAGINLEENVIEAVVADAQNALTSFITSDGSVEFPVYAHIVTAPKE